MLFQNWSLPEHSAQICILPGPLNNPFLLFHSSSCKPEIPKKKSVIIHSIISPSKHHRLFIPLTCFCSSPRLSHIDATIFETSPNVALGFCPLMAACVSLKNKAYADTGFWGSLGSFFFFPFLPPPPFFPTAGEMLEEGADSDSDRAGSSEITPGETDRERGDSTRTLWWDKNNTSFYILCQTDFKIKKCVFLTDPSKVVHVIILKRAGGRRRGWQWVFWRLRTLQYVPSTQSQPQLSAEFRVINGGQLVGPEQALAYFT